MDFEKRLREYVAVVQETTNKHFSDNYENLSPDQLSIAKGGRKYAKVVRNTGSQTMVHSFVDKTTGDVFKPADWRAPAKHARGNIFADDCGAAALVASGGVRYL